MEMNGRKCKKRECKIIWYLRGVLVVCKHGCDFCELLPMALWLVVSVGASFDQDVLLDLMTVSCICKIVCFAAVITLRSSRPYPSRCTSRAWQLVSGWQTAWTASTGRARRRKSWQRCRWERWGWASFRFTCWRRKCSWLPGRERWQRSWRPLQGLG